MVGYFVSERRTNVLKPVRLKWSVRLSSARPLVLPEGSGRRFNLVCADALRVLLCNFCTKVEILAQKFLESCTKVCVTNQITARFHDKTHRFLRTLSGIQCFEPWNCPNLLPLRQQMNWQQRNSE